MLLRRFSYTKKMNFGREDNKQKTFCMSGGFFAVYIMYLLQLFHHLLIDTYHRSGVLFAVCEQILNMPITQIYLILTHDDRLQEVCGHCAVRHFHSLIGNISEYRQDFFDR